MSKVSKEQYEQRAAFRKALRAFVRFSEEGARAEGITNTQHLLLLAVMGQPGRDWATISELADMLHVRHHGAVGLVDRCEKAGLVRRDRDTDDRRQVRVSLTPRGAGILERLMIRNRGEMLRLRDVLLKSTE